MKKFITKNKIYFEIFTPIIIGLLGIYIAYLQWGINDQLIKLQTIQIQPAFRIEYILHQNAEGFYNTESFKIHNDGYKIETFDYKINVFYEIEYKYKENIKKSYIPIDGFYFAQSEKSNLSGVMAEGICENNNAKFHQLHLECIQNCINGDYFFIKRIPLIEIRYTDVTKIVHYQYFNKYNKISKNEYNEFFIQTDNLKKKFPLNNDTVNFNTILNDYIDIR